MRVENKNRWGVCQTSVQPSWTHSAGCTDAQHTTNVKSAKLPATHFYTVKNDNGLRVMSDATNPFTSRSLYQMLVKFGGPDGRLLS